MNSHLFIHVFILQKIFNASEELALAAKYPRVRTFMAALKLSETELTDLIKVNLPWSVPTASESRMYLFIYSQNCLSTCS